MSHDLRACVGTDRAGSGWSDLRPRPRTMHQIVSELHTLLDKGGEPPPYVLVGHSYGGALIRMYQIGYPEQVAAMVLVEAASDDPWRITPDTGKVRSSVLATGAIIPPAKASGPLRESEIPSPIVALIEGQTHELAAHANDPPRDKLPADAKRMRTWSLGQLKMHASNDNPVEAEELAQLRGPAYAKTVRRSGRSFHSHSAATRWRWRRCWKGARRSSAAPGSANPPEYLLRRAQDEPSKRAALRNVHATGVDLPRDRHVADLPGDSLRSGRELCSLPRSCEIARRMRLTIVRLCQRRRWTIA